MFTIAAGVCLGIVAAVYILGFLQQHAERREERRAQRQRKRWLRDFQAEQQHAEQQRAEAQWRAEPRRHAVHPTPTASALALFDVIVCGSVISAVAAVIAAVMH